MAANVLLEIKKYDTQQLISFIEKNGKAEIKDIISEKGIDGATFLELTELQCTMWKLPLPKKKLLWTFLTQLRANPHEFSVSQDNVSQVKQNNNVIMLSKSLSVVEKNDLKQKLELTLSTKPTLESNISPKPKQNNSKDMPPSDPLSFYDEGYLTPISKRVSKEMENNYEPPPSEKNITHFENRNKTKMPNPSFLLTTPRKPLDLPRESTNFDYIDAPGTLSKEDINIHDDETEEVYEEAQDLDKDEKTPELPPRTIERRYSLKKDSMQEEKNKYDKNSTSNIKDVSHSVCASKMRTNESKENSSAFHRLLYLIPGYSSLRNKQSQNKPCRRKSLDSSDCMNSDFEYINVKKNSEKQTQKSITQRPLPSIPGNKSHMKSRQPLPLPEGEDAFKVEEESSEEQIYENNSQDMPTESDKDEENPKKKSITERPLPPIPGTKSIVEPRQPLLKTEDIAVLNDDDEFSDEQIYENNDQSTLEQSDNDTEHYPSDTESDSVPAKVKTPIENLFTRDILLPNPNSYEKFHNGTLPKPPRLLPSPPKELLGLDQILNQTEDDNEELEYDSAVFNLNNEPFYRNTDRKGARLLLKDLEDGAFLFRPSKRFFLTLSIKYRTKYFNLGIEKTVTNKIRINSDEGNTSPEFATINDLIEYFTNVVLTLQHENQNIELYLKKVLPSNTF